MACELFLFVADNRAQETTTTEDMIYPEGDDNVPSPTPTNQANRPTLKNPQGYLLT
jgi:hypothetical protein